MSLSLLSSLLSLLSLLPLLMNLGVIVNVIFGTIALYYSIYAIHQRTRELKEKLLFINKDSNYKKEYTKQPYFKKLILYSQNETNH
ncbi:hypothetical protein J3Q64DRAFT_1721796 [Phycomyces blakesleeanus]|uniref:Uncharacterized protein n=1 Tax=Phycomyces blakesleeanus TaxID=4837 RepID=A0ABR3BA62_PHYBL